MRLLIDECLSEDLAKPTREPGHAEASNVPIGKGGATDWELMPVILAATGPSSPRIPGDLRGPPDAPACAAYRAISRHLLLTGPKVGDPRRQRVDLALDH